MKKLLILILFAMAGPALAEVPDAEDIGSYDPFSSYKKKKPPENRLKICNEGNYQKFIYSKEKTLQLIKDTGKGCNLSGVNWKGKSFPARVVFRGALFIGANLSGASFVEADFIGADFTNVEAERASFTNSVLWKANVENANFTKARFLGAKLSALKNAKSAAFHKAWYNRKTQLPWLNSYFASKHNMIYIKTAGK